MKERDITDGLESCFESAIVAEVKKVMAIFSWNRFTILGGHPSLVKVRAFCAAANVTNNKQQPCSVVNKLIAGQIRHRGDYV